MASGNEREAKANIHNAIGAIVGRTRIEGKRKVLIYGV